MSSSSSVRIPTPRMPYISHSKRQIISDYTQLEPWYDKALDIYYELGDYDTPLTEEQWLALEGKKFHPETHFTPDKQIAWLMEQSAREDAGLTNSRDPKFNITDPALHRDQFGRLIETVPRSFRADLEPGGIWMTKEIFRMAWKHVFRRDYYASDYPEFYETKVWPTAREQAALDARGGARAYRDDYRKRSRHEYSHPMNSPFEREVARGRIIRAGRGRYMVSETVCDQRNRHHVWREHVRRYNMWEKFESNVEEAHSVGERNWKRAIEVLRDLDAFDVDHVVAVMRIVVGDKAFSHETAQRGLARLVSTGKAERIMTSLYRMHAANSMGLDGTLENGPRRWFHLLEEHKEFYRDWVAKIVVMMARKQEKNPAYAISKEDVLKIAAKHASADLASDNENTAYQRFMRYTEGYKAKPNALFTTANDVGKNYYRLKADVAKKLRSNNYSKKKMQRIIHDALMEWFLPIQRRSFEPFYIMWDDCRYIAPGVVADTVLWNYIRTSGLFYRHILVDRVIAEDENVPLRLKEAWYPSEKIYAMIYRAPPSNIENFEFIHEKTADGMPQAPVRVSVPWPTPHIKELNKELARLR